MNAFWNFFQTLLGLSLQPKDLTFVQISLRGIIVFLATLIMVRLGSKRSMAHRTPFDAILLVILASVLARAINGSAPFLGTIGGGAVLVALHRLFALLAFHSHSFGILVKGKPRRNRSRWAVRFPYDVAQPCLNPRSGGRHAPQRTPRRGCTSSTRMP